MIKDLIEQTGLPEKKVAELLFPDNTWPIHSLRRLIRKPEAVKEWQIEKLENIINSKKPNN